MRLKKRILVFVMAVLLVATAVPSISALAADTQTAPDAATLAAQTAADKKSGSHFSAIGRRWLCVWRHLSQQNVFAETKFFPLNMKVSGKFVDERVKTV